MWSFKRANFRKSNVISQAKCKVPNCAANVIAISDLGAKTVDVRITNYSESVLHDPTRKRKVMGSEKNIFESLLESKSAYMVRSKVADVEMEPGDPEPAHLPSSNALRIMKHRQKAQNLSTVHPALSLSELQRTYVNCIQEIGFNRFFVFYSTPLQRTWYKGETCRRKSIISIDATGLGLSVPTNKTYIFLYVITAHGKLYSYYIILKTVISNFLG